MAKKSPFWDAIAAGSVLDAIVDKDDPKRDSKIFTAQAATFFRSAFENDRIESEASSADFRRSLDSSYVNNNLQRENAELRRDLAQVQEQQIRIAQEEEKRKSQLAVVRKFIILAEGNIAEIESRFHLAIMWYWSQLIEQQLDPSSIGLDEMRALKRIDTDLAERETDLDTQSSKIVEAAKELIDSIATWSQLLTRKEGTLRHVNLDKSIRRYERRRMAAHELGLISSANMAEPINISKDAETLFVFICAQPASGKSISVESMEGVVPFDEAELKDLRLSIENAKAVQQTKNSKTQVSKTATIEQSSIQQENIKSELKKYSVFVRTMCALLSVLFVIAAASTGPLAENYEFEFIHLAYASLPFVFMYVAIFGTSPLQKPRKN